MAQHHSRPPKRIESTPPSSGETEDTALLYRQVMGRSVDRLNMATRGVKSRGAERILDFFTLPLVYTHQIERARQESPIKEPPSVDELANRLAQIRLRSLHKTVFAKVLGVDTYHDKAGAFVDYPEFTEEQVVLARAVHKFLQLPEDYDTRLGSIDARINLTNGQPAPEQLELISRALPTQLRLSPVMLR